MQNESRVHASGRTCAKIMMTKETKVGKGASKWNFLELNVVIHLFMDIHYLLDQNLKKLNKLYVQHWQNVRSQGNFVKTNKNDETFVVDS